MINLLLVLGPLAIWLTVSQITRLRPEPGIWPPQRGNLFTSIWAWAITALIYLGLWNLGTANMNPANLPAIVTWGLGGALLFLGNFLHLKGLIDLGLSGTSGWDVGVVEAGSYAFMRHPQYAAQGMVFVGWGIFAANPITFLLSVAAALTLWHVAETEERVMARRHSEAYGRYRNRVAATRLLASR
ncbi:MAG: methyltransferase [Pseudomonadota bacterium]